MKIQYVLTEGGRVIQYDADANRVDQPGILQYPSKILRGPKDSAWGLCDMFVYKDSAFQSLSEAQEQLMWDQLGQEPTEDDIYGLVWYRLPNNAPCCEPVVRIRVLWEKVISETPL